MRIVFIVIIGFVINLNILHATEVKTHRGVEINDCFTVNYDKYDEQTRIYLNPSIISNKMTGMYINYTNNINMVFIYAIITDRTYDNKKYYTDIEFIINFHDKYNRQDIEVLSVYNDKGNRDGFHINEVDSLIFKGTAYYSLTGTSPPLSSLEYFFTKSLESDISEIMMRIDNLDKNRINGINKYSEYYISRDNIKTLLNAIKIFNQLEE